MKKNPMQGPFKYLLLVVLLAVIAFALSNQNGNISNEKSYSELLTMIEEGQRLAGIHYVLDDYHMAARDGVIQILEYAHHAR